MLLQVMLSPPLHSSASFFMKVRHCLPTPKEGTHGHFSSSKGYESTVVLQLRGNSFCPLLCKYLSLPLSLLYSSVLGTEACYNDFGTFPGEAPLIDALHNIMLQHERKVFPNNAYMLCSMYMSPCMYVRTYVPLTHAYCVDVVHHASRVKCGISHDCHGKLILAYVQTSLNSNLVCR